MTAPSTLNLSACTLRSMTAYGRGCVAVDAGELVVEIQALNRRHLEIVVVLPPEMTFHEPAIRRALAALCVRGKLTVRVYLHEAGPKQNVLRPNLSLALALKQAWDELGKELQIPPDRLQDPHLYASHPELLISSVGTTSIEWVEAPLFAALEKAMEQLEAMRLCEGKALYSDLDHRLSLLIRSLELIEPQVDKTVERQQNKLMEKLKEVGLADCEGKERLERELILFADRVDITEEITRLRAHIGQFQENMMVDERGKGKRFEFLLQEMAREVTTIASKSSDLMISQQTVQMRTELERIREQVQNVE